MDSLNRVMMSGEIHEDGIFNLPSLSLLICKMGEIIAPPQSCWGGRRIPSEEPSVRFGARPASLARI